MSFSRHAVIYDPMSSSGSKQVPPRRTALSLIGAMSFRLAIPWGCLSHIARLCFISRGSS